MEAGTPLRGGPPQAGLPECEWATLIKNEMVETPAPSFCREPTRPILGRPPGGGTNTGTNGGRKGHGLPPWEWRVL